MKLKDLANPFPAEGIEWRIQRADVKVSKPWAMVLAYVTNRAVQDRLDEVVGPENWQNEYAPAPDGGVLCGISIKVENEWVKKWDGAGNTNIEEVKGGLSGAMKRAAVQWGIGRYLYDLEATFVPLHKEKDEGTQRYFDTESKQAYYWNIPKLPLWALPKRQNGKE